MTMIQDLSGWGGWHPGSDGRVLRAGHLCSFLEASDTKLFCALVIVTLHKGSLATSSSNIPFIVALTLRQWGWL